MCEGDSFLRSWFQLVLGGSIKAKVYSIPITPVVKVDGSTPKFGGLGYGAMINQYMGVAPSTFQVVYSIPCLLHSLKLTAKAPENRPNPKRKESSSNPPFSGAKMLVSGSDKQIHTIHGQNYQNPNFPNFHFFHHPPQHKIHPHPKNTPESVNRERTHRPSIDLLQPAISPIKSAAASSIFSMSWKALGLLDVFCLIVHSFNLHMAWRIFKKGPQRRCVVFLDWTTSYKLYVFWKYENNDIFGVGIGNIDISIYNPIDHLC